VACALKILLASDKNKQKEFRLIALLVSPED